MDGLGEAIGECVGELLTTALITKSGRWFLVTLIGICGLGAYMYYA